METKGKYRIKDYSSMHFSSIDEADIENLHAIANCSLRDLCNNKFPNLLIYPKELNAYKDDIDNGVICSINNENLCTNDIMGFIGINDTQLTICSRFAAIDNEDYFLHYMVQKVFSINLFDLKHSISKDRVFDFLVYLFPYHLKAALRQGLFKQYNVNYYNDANVKGTVDISRHIKQNIPFSGKVAYRVREFSYDNPITQLIRHTIEYIKVSHMSGVLKSDSSTEEAISLISGATKAYKTQDRQKIISKNIKPLRHPYFNAYIPLQKLCIQILRHKGLKYGVQNDKIYGILFSGSWLWEEFLYKSVLCDCGFKHPHNKAGKGGIYLFEKNTDTEVSKFSRFKRYPDYFKDDFILDAKYKHLEDGRIDRNDMHQVISYMHVEEAKLGGFIYPNDKVSNDKIVFDIIGQLRGQGGSIYNIGVSIPQGKESYKDFVKSMETIEQKLRTEIK